MPEIMRPELVDLTDAEVEAVSGGQNAVGGDGGDAGNFNWTVSNSGNGGAGGAGGDATAED